MAARSAPYPGAQAVSRAIAVLKTFTDLQPRLTLAEISRGTRLNRATAHRLAAALEQEGLLVREAGGEAYRLGPEAIVLGSRALRANPLRQISRPELESLAHATRETASLEVLVDREMLIVDEVLSPGLVAGAPAVGTRWAAHATSTGKAVLAFGPEAAVTAYLRRALPVFTSETIAAADAFRQTLAAVRARGYATVRDELELGYAAVAAPVLDHEGRPAGALCVGGPSVRLTPDRLAEIAPLVRRSAEQLARQLGFDRAWPWPG